MSATTASLSLLCKLSPSSPSPTLLTLSPSPPSTLLTLSPSPPLNPPSPSPPSPQAERSFALAEEQVAHTTPAEVRRERDAVDTEYEELNKAVIKVKLVVDKLSDAYDERRVDLDRIRRLNEDAMDNVRGCYQ